MTGTDKSGKAKLAETLREVLPSDVFTDTEASALMQKNSPDARYGLIKRAIASGDIIQLRRGVYALGKRYRRQPFNLFELANKIYSPSYVSLESALSYHGWIPEAAYTTTSISAKRSKEFKTPAGVFSYTRIPRFNFIGVERMVQGKSIFLIATPTKALIDYVYVNKIEKMGISELADSLRIESEYLGQISLELVTRLVDAYRSKHVARFVRTLLRGILK
ncbi:type IV toxin-antitoxin system AbiEi family antitoxin domain-containing protein [bacterium]|nr:type IV toxin-antitoxin system AbiEi family antitoxin domain-containing protein [bacterium]